MHRLRYLALVAGMLCAMGAALGAPAPKGTTFYLAPGGSDANPGTQQAPFATLARARDAVRALKAKNGGALKEPVTILLRGGLYLLTEAVAFGPEDSGTAECPITYAAYPGERPVLSGGRRVTGWKPDKDGLWRAEWPGAKERSGIFRQLFIARPGQPYFERRYRPTRGFMVTAGPTNAAYRNPNGPLNHRNSQDEFHFHKGDLKQWEDLEDAELVAMHDWSSGRFSIRGLDLEKNIVKLSSYPHYRIGHWYPGGRNPYYLENLREDLGKPGEWYLDRKAGAVLYKPLPGEDLRTATVIAPVLETLVRVTGDVAKGAYVEHLTFRGIGFAHAEWKLAPHEYALKYGRDCRQGFVDMPSAVEVKAARQCRFERCDFNHNGSYGLDLADGCHNNTVIGCRFVDNGTGGLKLGTVDRGAKPPIVPTGNQILNNLVSDVGVVHYSGHGIWGGICAGTRIAHNVVRRTSYSPIAVGWDHSPVPTACRDNVMEYNHIYDVMTVLDHGGALYTLGNQPGTILRGNLIHDTHHTRLHGDVPRPMWAGGPLGLDDGSSGFLIEENITYNTAGDPGFTVQRDNKLHTWRNNFFSVKPDAPEFPKQIAARAGLEEPYRDLLSLPMKVTPSPFHAMTLPKFTGGNALLDDYEGIPLGRQPHKGYCRVENSGAGQGTDAIAVTNETAAEGAQSVKLVDAPNLSREWLPYLSYDPGYRDGNVTVSFFARVEEGAILEHSWRGRSKTAQFSVGPWLRLAGGKLSIADRELMEIPIGAWVRYEIRTKLGVYDPGIGGAGRRTDAWDLTVTLPGGAKRTFTGIKNQSAEFQDLNWVGFVSMAQEKTVLYLDRVSIANE